MPPGGSNDVLSRITAQFMSPGPGQQVVIDNRAGVAGMIGAEPAMMTLEQLTQFITTDIVRWRQVARDANIRLKQAST